MKRPFLFSQKHIHLLLGLMVFAGLYLTSLYSYPLFHSLSEIFSIVIACGIFMIAWNSRQFLENNYLLFIGIAFLSVAGLDLVHTLAYKGMGAFKSNETNLSTQLWIVARYVESISLLIAPIFLKRKLRPYFVFFTYILATSFLLASVFYWDIFPVCFVEGVGLTLFKKISEYVISLILLGSIFLLLKNQREFERDVLQWVVWSITLTIVSELAFTFYIDVYGLSNLIGHFLKILAFYFLYKAIIETVLKRPYDLLFRNLKKSEEALRDALRESQLRQAEISALLEGARAVLEHHEFKVSAQSIFDSCKNLIGAPAGYIALLSKDGTENELVFLDSGGLPCTVDPNLPMPIRGLREEAYRTGKTVFNNDFPKSIYMKYMPEGHARLDSVLFAPLVIRGKVIGLLGLANKPGGFIENDARMASALGELAAIALQNSHTLESLEVSEQRFRSVVQTASDAIISVDGWGDIVFWNDSAKTIFGYSTEEVTGKPLTFMMPERFREAHQKAINRMVSTGKSTLIGETVEMVGLRKDGTEFPLELSLATWGMGGEIFFTGIIRDITERKKLEEALRKYHDELEIRVQERTIELSRAYKKLEDQSKILEGFFTSTITPLIFLDRNFNYIRVNEAYAKACQRDISEFPGHNHFEFYPSDAKAIFEQVVETKTPYQAIARPFTFPDHPEWGETYWDWTLTPILNDEDEVEFLVFSLEDVTERKRAEKAVKAERQRFNDVLEMLPAYLVLLTPDYHVPFANRFFRERFGESHGRRCFEYLFGRSEPCEICETYTVLKTMAPHEWEWTGPDGRIYNVFDFPLTDTDGSLLILEMGIDITERKRAEEKVRAASLYTRSLIEASLDPLVTISKDGKIMDVNNATELVTGVPREQLIWSDFSDSFTQPEKAREGYRNVFSKGAVRDYPLAIRHRSGMITDVLYNATIYRNEAGEIQGVFAAARDITKRKEAERRTNATNVLLNLFSKKTVQKEYLDAAVDLIQNWSGCHCVGIRILDERNYIPYDSYTGFSQEFWKSENLLSIQKDQCICIRVVTGESDPQDISVVTPRGSFRCDNIVKFINNLSEQEKKRYRGVCIQNGFLSVAIIPIRYLDKIVGAIHLADEREAFVPPSVVEFIETMAPLIGEAINRFNLEEEIRESENRLRALSSQLLTIQEKERKRIARELHDGLGQVLTAIKFKVENALQQEAEDQNISKEKSLETVIPMIRESIEEVRRIQMDLRPSTLDDLGILATIGWLTREFQKVYSHIQIEKQLDLQEAEVPDPLKITLYRITQEALNNIAKHSKADRVRLSLKKKEDGIELVVEDYGLGFDINNFKKGFGIASMRERTELSGGSFTIESTQEAGTTIRASWPTL